MASPPTLSQVQTRWNTRLDGRRSAAPPPSDLGHHGPGSITIYSAFDPHDISILIDAQAVRDTGIRLQWHHSRFTNDVAHQKRIPPPRPPSGPSITCGNWCDQGCRKAKSPQAIEGPAGGVRGGKMASGPTPRHNLRRHGIDPLALSFLSFVLFLSLSKPPPTGHTSSVSQVDSLSNPSSRSYSTGRSSTRLATTSPRVSGHHPHQGAYLPGTIQGHRRPKLPAPCAPGGPQRNPAMASSTKVQEGLGPGDGSQPLCAFPLPTPKRSTNLQHQRFSAKAC